MENETVTWAKQYETVRTLFNRMAVKLPESHGTILSYSIWIKLWSEFSK